MTAPTGSAYVAAVADRLIAAGIGVGMREADLDEERCNLPIRDGAGNVTWLRWAYDNGWYLDDPDGWPAAPICPPDTPADQAAKRLADYL